VPSDEEREPTEEELEDADDCDLCGHPWADHTIIDPQTTLRGCRVMAAQQRCDCEGYR
jgi:hypothetical protein